MKMELPDVNYVMKMVMDIMMNLNQSVLNALQ